jgi:hypothetical protein
MKIEINLSDHYRQYIIGLLSGFSIFNDNNNYPNRYLDMTSYLFLIAIESQKQGDLLHKSIGAYNTYRIHFNNSSGVYIILNYNQTKGQIASQPISLY